MPEENKKLGQYTLLEKIAQGGMAQVFKAKTSDVNGFERLVVIKRILPHISADPEYVEMLVDEAKIAVNFNHGNIAQIFDLGRVKNDYFIVMEYVDGKTFSHINKKLKHHDKKIPLDILLYCAIETCRGLSYIHNKKSPDGKKLGVVHRDISPQNIILSYAGQIKIIDFGVAKASIKEGKTESGVLKGKFAYMSPEQARSDHVDFRSDIFSMGILLWETATGKRLFKQKTNHDTVQAIQKAKFDNASSIRDDLPKDFDRIIKKALQKNPKNRYQDASDMAIEMEKLLFNLKPDFKPVQAAEFIYKLFGSEEDEKDLPDHLFVKENTPFTKIKPQNKAVSPKKKDSLEDPTIKETADHHTPVFKIIKPAKTPSKFIWLIAFFAFIFISGTLYVYLVNKAESASIFILGFNQNMQVYINNSKVNVPDGKVDLESEKSYKLKITQKGFYEFSKTVYLKPFEQKKIKVPLKKIKPETGHLVINTTPSGATIYINSMEWKAVTPVKINTLDIGKDYTIGLFLEKYQFKTKKISIKNNDDIIINHNFEQNFSYISVTSNPIGAVVFINGKKMGVTPYQNSNITPHKDLIVAVQKPKYIKDKMKVNLSPGEEKTINFDLTRRD